MAVSEYDHITGGLTILQPIIIQYKSSESPTEDTSSTTIDNSQELNYIGIFQQQQFAYGRAYKYKLQFHTTSNKFQFYIKLFNHNAEDFNYLQQYSYVSDNVIKLSKQFDNNDNTVILYYRDNEIEGVNLFNNNIDELIVNDAGRLKYINVNKNKLKYLNTTNLYDLQQLLSCDNYIETIFINNPKLKHIDLSNNNLQMVDLSSIQMCKTVDVRFNKSNLEYIFPKKVLNNLF